MAKTNGDAKPSTTTTTPSAPTGAWTPEALVSALRAARRKGDRVAALKRSGILTKDGRLAKKYKTWGKKVSRTPKAKDIAAA